jgi:hypothetical protein
VFYSRDDASAARERCRSHRHRIPRSASLFLARGVTEAVALAEITACLGQIHIRVRSLQAALQLSAFSSENRLNCAVFCAKLGESLGGCTEETSSEHWHRGRPAARGGGRRGSRCAWRADDTILCCVRNLPNQAPDLLHLFQLLFRRPSRRLDLTTESGSRPRSRTRVGHFFPTQSAKTTATHRTPAAGVLRGGAKGDDARHRGRHPPGKPPLRRANVLACCRLPVGKRCVRVLQRGLVSAVSPHTLERLLRHSIPETGC